MAGSDLPHDAAKALEYKESGNRCFQAGDYAGAEVLYSQAITYDPANPLLYTNRSLTLLHLNSYARVIEDARKSISLMPENMKAYYHLAQAQIALHQTAEALTSSRTAHEFCVQEIYRGGKGGTSIGPITELVLKCKKEWWEQQESNRLKERGGLLQRIVGWFEEQKRDTVKLSTENAAKEVADFEPPKNFSVEEHIKEVERHYDVDIEEVKRTFELAGTMGEEGKRRQVPDWIVDEITFSVMYDPVVTRTGKSYERSSIMEHLKRSPTDPLTREPLRVQDLRPNLALKEACNDFLRENGWAVDW